MLETIRLSQQSKEQLIRVKRHTGIKNWNVLCRWALARSLEDPAKPPRLDVDMSNVEMSWKTFCGAQEATWRSLLLLRASSDLVPADECLNRHLARGVARLTDVGQLTELLAP